jgi:16S rRNA G1207 methylase RsmC
MSAAQILIARGVSYEGCLAIKTRGRLRATVGVRPRESDLFVLSQVFGWTEYDIGRRREASLITLMQATKENGDVPIIIDAGANVGYSSLYLADVYRDALVIAVEPNLDSFDILQKNCAANERIRPVRAALWHHDDDLP